jgi:hypothetical protein
MNKVRKWLRWGLGAGAFLALSAGLAGLGHAQVPSQAPKEKRIYTNKNSFRMPVKIVEADRANLKEVRLYVKHGTADWVCQETAAPTVQFFNYQVPRDGEYWFSIAMVDRHGVMTPSDIAKQPAGLQVVVDTTPPDLEFKTMAAPDGETCLHCIVKDANPDYQTLRITCKSGSGEQMLEPHPFKAGLFHVPEVDIWGSVVRVSVTDRCGNRTVREMRVPTLGVSGQATSLNTAPKSDSTAVHQTKFQPGKQEAASTDKEPPVQSSNTKTEEPAAPKPTALPSVTSAPAPLKSIPETRSEPEAHHKSAAGTVSSFAGGASTTTSGNSGAASPASRQLLNTSHAALEYRIDQVGPSGVGKVEVWITGDQGHSWQRLREDSDRRSPADVELPGEGLFGVTLVVTNGNGFGGKPPSRGDAPTAWIEVDTTPPAVQVRDTDPSTDGGTLEIRWHASDKNLSEEPVNLYFRTRADGPWKLIAKGVKNEGTYRWTFPHDMGSQFFFRVEVADQAGNVAHADSTTAVVLDMTEPRAFVVGVTGVNGRQR